MRAWLVAAAAVLPLAGAAQMPSFPTAPPDHVYGRVILDNFSTRAGVPAVAFDHWAHRAAYTCRACHVDLGFALQKQETRVSAATNRQGLHCGACHDGRAGRAGRTAFAACSSSAELSDPTCRRCHVGADDDPTSRYRAFKQRLPEDDSGYIDWEAAERMGKIKPSDHVEGVSLRNARMTLHRDVPMIAIGTWLGNISFSHAKHTAWAGCELCHPEIFPVTQRGSTKFTMKDIEAGRACGACHNLVAFPLAQCGRCHELRQRKFMR